jgi:putative FmdB family regulatory protein
MPAYDYICASCSKIFEVTKQINDPHPSECPDCRTGPVERYHAGSKQFIQYKGKGWMKTDGKY